MAFIDQFKLGYSQQIEIIGREEKTANLNLTSNPVAAGGNLSGRVTSGGSPVVGATVKVFDVNNNPIEHTNTGGQGQYSINNLPNGSYQIIAVANGYLIPTSIPVTIQSNKTTTANIVLQPDTNANLNAIFGIVRDTTTLAPIDSAIVNLFTSTEGQPPALVATAPTNDRGQYLFTLLPSGDYYVEASKLGYLSKQSAPINVSNKEYADADITLSSDPQSNTGTISGFINNQATGLPIPNATVALYSIESGSETVIALAKTSAAGRYLFANINPGTYRVKATLQVES